MVRRKKKTVKKSSKKKTVRSRGVNIDRMQDKAEEREEERKRQGTGIWTPDEGKNRIRILPPWTEEGETFFKEVFIHYNIPPGADDTFGVFCTMEETGRCFICERVQELFRGDEADVDLASEINRRKQYFSNVIDLDDKWKDEDETTPKVQVFRYGNMIFDELLALFCDSDYGDITDVDAGRDITIKRSGSGKRTRYNVTPRGKNTSLEKHHGFDVDNVFEALIDLDQLEGLSRYYKVLDYDNQREAYDGIPADETSLLEEAEEDEDWEEEAEEDEDWEEEDEDWEEEDEEDWDEEDEEEDEDDELEDESEEIEKQIKAAIKKKKKSRAKAAKPITSKKKRPSRKRSSKRSSSKKTSRKRSTKRRRKK